jgi:large subunit ribosomal protein L22
MIITAKGSHLPHPPRKVQLIAKMIAGKKAISALTTLEFTQKHAAKAVARVLKQAIANAKNNLKSDPNTLFIDQIFATKGRSMKKVRFAGRGRRRLYEKTTSHLTVNLKSHGTKS